jgi:hypothetical protein
VCFESPGICVVYTCASVTWDAGKDVKARAGESHPVEVEAGGTLQPEGDVTRALVVV